MDNTTDGFAALSNCDFTLVRTLWRFIARNTLVFLDFFESKGEVISPVKSYKSNCDYRNIFKELEISFECFNVGCMMPYMDYTPRTLEEIKDWRQEQSEQLIFYL